VDQTHVSFRQLLEAAPDAMLVVDGAGRISLANSQTEHLFGYDREELLGEPIEILVPHNLQARHAEHRSAYQLDSHRRPMGTGLELSGRRKDGSWFPVEISLSPVKESGGTLIMAAVRDITVRARVQKALTSANRELEAFTYSVSHDLRAPIRQIDGFARLLDEHLGDSLDEKGRHYLARIQDGAVSMGKLVDDLLHLAHLGRQEPRPERVELDGVVKQVLAELQSDLDGRMIEWRVNALPSVVCDRGLIRIVFTNLISNALKYTRPRRPAVIEIGYEESDAGPIIAIRDNGVGFDMTYADKLFGVFQRLHRVEEFEGTGVGLATVQRIVHKHGGDIWTQAAPDEGATFFFTLPVGGGVAV
jgi:PAS domain S-box-containing protein